MVIYPYMDAACYLSHRLGCSCPQNLNPSAMISELYQISGVRTPVKPKMAEFEELLYKTSILVLYAVNVVTKTLV